MKAVTAFVARAFTTFANCVSFTTQAFTTRSFATFATRWSFTTKNKTTLVWIASIARVVFVFVRYGELLANALRERGMEVFHRLNAYALAASGCMNIGAVFNIDAYVIHTRSGTPKEQVAGL